MADMKQIGLGMMAGVAVGAVALGVGAAGAQAQDRVESKLDRSSKRSAIVSEVLGIERDELKDRKQAGESFEEIVLSAGFSSVEDFKSELEVRWTETLREQGLSEEEIQEKLAAKQERQDVRADIKAVASELLGVEEGDGSLKDKTEREALLEAAGFEDKEAFREAVRAKVIEQWQAEGLTEEEAEQRLESGQKGRKAFNKLRLNR